MSSQDEAPHKHTFVWAVMQRRLWQVSLDRRRWKRRAKRLDLRGSPWCRWSSTLNHTGENLSQGTWLSLQEFFNIPLDRTSTDDISEPCDHLYCCPWWAHICDYYQPLTSHLVLLNCFWHEMWTITCQPVKLSLGAVQYMHIFSVLSKYALVILDQARRSVSFKNNKLDKHITA